MIVTDQLFNATSHISRNMRYRVFCDRLFGASVSFGAGDETFDVQIIEPFQFDDVGPVKAGNDGTPALSVWPDSVAAGRLSDRLCDRIITRIPELMIHPLTVNGGCRRRAGEHQSVLEVVAAA